ncbi:uncharacterized protein B0H18DRAFT_30671 [Fomitopsis serialis]|uniref:uncharacterized protein n=1 Tax=Fomitopsis serialis TaxID=139415 RepID=UPI002007565F|nr:uncharacterized protein B0H18DRAFT_30671 [Neoantrodia serialis]KAH9932573.1 hypothetical protein B0H18DRAFT_30671 [Neoantrodia serialis]
MDMDCMSLPRRISFSTSCERDKPFIAPRPMLATRTARSCPPINDLLTPATLPVSRPFTAEAETTSCLSIASLLSSPSCDLPESSPTPSSYVHAVSASPPSNTAVSCYSPEPAPPTRVKPTSSLYALLNPVDEPYVSPQPPANVTHAAPAGDSADGLLCLWCHSWRKPSAKLLTKSFSTPKRSVWSPPRMRSFHVLRDLPHLSYP